MERLDSCLQLLRQVSEEELLSLEQSDARVPAGRPGKTRELHLVGSLDTLADFKLPSSLK